MGKEENKEMNPQPLEEVYEKFEHLDICLSDTEWCRKASEEHAAIYGIAGELWRAIVAARERYK